MNVLFHVLQLGIFDGLQPLNVYPSLTNVVQLVPVGVIVALSTV